MPLADAPVDERSFVSDGASHQPSIRATVGGTFGTLIDVKASKEKSYKHFKSVILVQSTEPRILQKDESNKVHKTEESKTVIHFLLFCTSRVTKNSTLDV